MPCYRAAMAGAESDWESEEPAPPGPTIGGEGSVSTSNADYPPTGPVTSGDIWLDPMAGTNGNGTEGSPYNSIYSALSALSDGERIIVRAGTIALTSQITRNTSWTTGVEVFAYGDERPVIDASGLSGSARALYFASGRREHWKGFEVRDGPGRGVNIEASETHIEDFRVHGFQGDGVYIADFGTGAASNKVWDTIVYDLGDGISQGTNVPDGFVVTGNTGSPSEDNEFVRCVAKNAPDDGFDCYRGRGTRFVDCVASESGYYTNGNPAGDGNGFKMGGSDSDSGDNRAIGCLSVDNRATGFTHNEAANTTGTDPNVVFAFCTADGNGSRGFNTGGDNANHLNVRRDCLITNNDGLGYVGPNAVNLRDITTPTYIDRAGSDYSMDVGSDGILDGIEEGIGNSVATQPTSGTATNAGASQVALQLAFDWLPAL